jgi:UDP-hydrolysing UDP-N-acetyl-D-glucosamine 2-epimerase
MREKKRICFVIHNRANFARIKSVIESLSSTESIEIFLVLASSSILRNFGRVEDNLFISSIKEKVQIFNVVMGNEPITMVKTTGLAAIELSQVFHRIRPNCVVTVADRHETLATAIAASYMNIPLVHTQGGEVSGSIDESVRHACTKLAHLHFPATEKAKRTILRMGENPEFVFNFGCPAMDVLRNAPNLPAEDVLAEYKGVGPRIETNSGFLIVIQHSVTTHFESSERDTFTLLKAVINSGKPAIWLWPNVDSGSEYIAKQIRRFRESSKDSLIQFFTNFSPEHYASLLKQASCIVGNSSSGIRESSFLGLPSVTIGDRQSEREVGENVKRVQFQQEEILSAIQFQWEHGKYEPSGLYGDGTAGKKIANKLLELEIPISKKFFWN